MIFSSKLFMGAIVDFFKERIGEKTTYLGVIGLIMYVVDNIDEVKNTVDYFTTKPLASVIVLIMVILVFMSEKGREK